MNLMRSSVCKVVLRKSTTSTSEYQLEAPLSRQISEDGVTFYEFDKVSLNQLLTLPHLPIEKKQKRIVDEITCVDMDSGSIEVYNTGCRFSVIHTNYTERKQSSCTLEVKYSNLFPKIAVSKEKQLYFLPLYTDLQFVFKDKTVLHYNLDENCQEFEINGFCYQLFQFSSKFSPLSSDQIQRVFTDGLFIGHRGSGMNKNYSSDYKTQFNRQVRVSLAENTLISFKNALKVTSGCEFDVILTIDRQPVINHDLGVDTTIGKVPINSITLEQFQKIQIIGSMDRIQHSTDDYWLYKQNEPVFITGKQNRPSFRELLQVFDKTDKIAFCEIKYPNILCKSVGSQYFARTVVADEVFKAISECQNVNVLFLTFDSQLAYILRKAQNKYPVLFLCCGDGVVEDDEEVDYKLQQCLTIKSGLEFVMKSGLHGMVMPSKLVSKYFDDIQAARARGAIVMTYGNVGNVNTPGTDGHISDAVHL